MESLTSYCLSSLPLIWLVNNFERKSINIGWSYAWKLIVGLLFTDHPVQRHAFDATAWYYVSLQTDQWQANSPGSWYGSVKLSFHPMQHKQPTHATTIAKQKKIDVASILAFWSLRHLRRLRPLRWWKLGLSGSAAARFHRPRGGRLAGSIRTGGRGLAVDARPGAALRAPAHPPGQSQTHPASDWLANRQQLEQLVATGPTALLLLTELWGKEVG